MTDEIYRTDFLLWPKIGLWCSEIAAVMEVAAICCMLHLYPASFRVRRIASLCGVSAVGERLKWGINIFFSQVILKFALLDGKIDKTKQHNNNRAHLRLSHRSRNTA